MTTGVECRYCGEWLPLDVLGSPAMHCKCYYAQHELFAQGMKAADDELRAMFSDTVHKLWTQRGWGIDGQATRAEPTE